MNILAWQMMSRSELDLMLIEIALLLLGFCLGLFLWRKTVFALRRVPYFLLVVSFVFATNISAYIWAFVPEAVANHLLWLLVLQVFSITFLSGTALGAAAQARSFSAFGNAGKGWLAMIPFVNLALVFAPPQTPLPFRSGMAKGLDAVAVLVGLVVFGLGNALSRDAENFVVERTAIAAGNPATANAFLDLRLGAGDLPAVLQETASKTQTGRIDELTVFDSIVAEGHRLTFIYSLDAAAGQIGVEQGGFLAKTACSDPYFAKLMNAGATVEHIYHSADRAQTYSFIVDKDDCTL